VRVFHRRRQVSVGLVVVGLHLLAVLAWWTLGRDQQPTRKSEELASITIWLPGVPELSTEPAKLVNRQHSPSSELSRRRDRDNAKRTFGATLTTAPTFDAALMPAAQSASAEVPTPPASALDLTLSRKALSSLVAPSIAAQSPFHGRLPATIERQIADVAGDSGPWTDEIIDSDHVRLRRGSTCVMLERPQAAMLDPFSDAMRRIPWVANVSRCR
jgi:hypothetical protein